MLINVVIFPTRDHKLILIFPFPNAFRNAEQNSFCEPLPSLFLLQTFPSSWI